MALLCMANYILSQRRPSGWSPNERASQPKERGSGRQKVASMRLLSRRFRTLVSCLCMSWFVFSNSFVVCISVAPRRASAYVTTTRRRRKKRQQHRIWLFHANTQCEQTPQKHTHNSRSHVFIMVVERAGWQVHIWTHLPDHVAIKYMFYFVLAQFCIWVEAIAAPLF